MSGPRKICAFIQTYSDNREILFRFHNVDNELVAFLNSFDKVFFSFHNCSEPYTQRMCDSVFLKSLRNVEILKYGPIPYPHSFLQSLLRFWRDGYEYLVFLQDDVFTFEPGSMDELSQLIRTANYNFLALEVNDKDLRIGEDRLVEQEGGTQLFKASSEEFKAAGMYACDDGAYAGRIEYLMTRVYTPVYFQCANVWDAENAMNDHVMRNPVERYCSNYRTFKRYNIVGGNTWNKENDLRLLNTRFRLNIQF